ncbi:hypothetical protein N7456_000498 [Penicillium angulare]|uniref:Heterokaryon incompatibility domain-containing protein n=1 Tax=Penicillium angulare TaxID=116970 RepID=A0A9W9KS66_9EURO|nr:hypothetical protein N7456_000498 [Penicillium angulare]
MTDDDRYTRPHSDYPTEISINPKTQTRILILEPGKYNDPICCSLTVENIPEGARGDFDALSYVWGDWIGCGSICVNGVSNFPVTQNLWRALRRLRREDIYQFFWIDQITINQGDLEERTEQVSQMGRIFQQARRVIIWLGDVEDSSSSWSFGSKSTKNKKKQITKNIMKAVYENPVQNVQPWWTRAWVIQEYALGKELPIIMFGSEQVEWRELMEFSKSKDVDDGPFRTWTKILQSLQDYEYLRKGDQSFFLLTANLANTKTRVPHDKIYCILPSLAPQERALITVDYKRSVSETFCQATWVSMVSSSRLEILGLIDSSLSQRLEAGYPSWMTDFTFPNHEKPLHLLQMEDGKFLTKAHDKIFQPYDSMFKTILRVLFAFEAWEWSWCKKQPKFIAEPIWDASNHQQLVLQGLEFDNISHLVNVKTEMSVSTVMTASGQVQNYMNIIAPNSSSSLTSWIDEKSWKPMERELNDSIQRHITKENPYQRVNEASLQRKGAPYQPPIARKEPLRVFLVDSLFRKWDQTARPKTARKIFSPSVSGAFEFLKLKDDPNFSGRREMTSLMAWGLRTLQQMNQLGNIFFVTSSGFIGLGPADLRMDDKIVLLYGSQFPAALRRTENGNWRFVGFVYVRGIMNEELFECFSDLELKESKFVLE